MLQPENQSKKYEHLFTDIDSGRVKIPQFQRDFVWGKSQTAALIDSVIKGYPIGTFIFWKTTEDLRSYREIGNVTLPTVPSGDAVQYVLDGQQRITSLYAVRKGLILDREGQELDYRDIYIDLSVSPDDDIQLVHDAEPGGPAISVHDLLVSDLADLIEDRDKDEVKLLDTYRKRLTGYDFSTIVISDYPIEVACDVFTRINTGGTELTLFEIMVAKTYDPERGFDLAAEYDLLLDNPNGRDLGDAKYDTVPEGVVLQCVSAHLAGSTLRKDILRLDKGEFIEAWPVVKDALFAAVDFLRQTVGVPVSRILPSDLALVPLAYFFARRGDKESPAQARYLSQFFWWASFSSRYSAASGGKLALDLRRMDEILEEKPPLYRPDEQVALSAGDIGWARFSTGDAFSKAVLCVLADQGPRSFRTGATVDLDNSWLKASNSKNYHHFFPKAYLRKKGVEDWQANVIANITFVDDYLNKQQIRAKPPSIYMRTYAEENVDLSDAMRTHLIGDLEDFGIWNDDYGQFVAARSEWLLQEVTGPRSSYQPV